MKTNSFVGQVFAPDNRSFEVQIQSRRLKHRDYNKNRRSQIWQNMDESYKKVVKIEKKKILQQNYKRPKAIKPQSMVLKIEKTVYL